MAVKWAVANGNWNAAATWNDGVVPQSGDVVYLNGHDVELSSVNFTFNGTIRNDAHDDIISGGMLKSGGTGTYPTYIMNISKLIANGGIILKLSFAYRSGANLYITSDISSNHAGAVLLIDAGVSDPSGAIFSLNYTGNISAHNLIEKTGRDYPTIRQSSINGNISLTGAFMRSGQNLLSNLIINGLAEFSADQNIPTLTTTGQLKSVFATITATTLTINGSITYKSTNNTMGVRYTTLNILNPDTFTWKDVTEPRSNPFIILTDAEMNNRQQYPHENEVKEGTEYVWGEKVGTYQQPPESVVLKGYVYDNGDKIGSLENQNIVGCVTKEDVREGVALIGMGEVGTLVVPSVDDVREGVIFDNGSVGTLIVEGGGERLRIADFGYYTRSTSITYIVDLTESDKPAFADCEEIVLRSLFPTLDLDNIPDKFFDDLFVQFLRYRLLVEYYRGTSINSKFTPSEPTAEIVNYANTKCEYWLNTANLFLQLWGEKYPNSVKKDRILL